MNQEKEWWRSLVPQVAEPLTLTVGTEVITLDSLFEKIATEATRRGESKAWEEMLAEVKVIIKDHKIKNIGDHHDAEGLTKAYHLAYKEMRGIAEDRLTHLKKL